MEAVILPLLRRAEAAEAAILLQAVAVHLPVVVVLQAAVQAVQEVAVREEDVNLFIYINIWLI